MKKTTQPACCGEYLDGTPDFYRHVIAEVPEVAKIVEALEEMIDIACKVDSWESFPSGPIERAEDAIRDYRAQCGN